MRTTREELHVDKTRIRTRTLQIAKVRQTHLFLLDAAILEWGRIIKVPNQSRKLGKFRLLSLL